MEKHPIVQIIGGRVHGGGERDGKKVKWRDSGMGDEYMDEWQGIG